MVVAVADQGKPSIEFHMAKEIRTPLCSNL